MKPYYEDDFVTIYHGDCREFESGYETDLDVLVSDPPYGIGWKQGDYAGAGKRSPRFLHAGIANDDSTDVRDEVLESWDGRPGIVFGSLDVPAPPFTVQTLIWQKPAGAGVVGSVTGYRRDIEAIYLIGDWPRRIAAWSSVLAPHARGMVDLGRNHGHPHAKPVSLMRTLIKRSPDGLIYDPFMGSGSTLRAAKDLGRRAIGIEIEERYCEIAAQRMGQEVLDFGAAA